jgi:hypothetical protein
MKALVLAGKVSKAKKTKSHKKMNGSNKPTKNFVSKSEGILI